MPAANLIKFPTSSPADSSPLLQLAKASDFTTDSILGIVGKTEGNGCVNDFSRTLSSHVWDEVIPRTGISVFSGGTEGVLSPHVAFILESKQQTGLTASVSRTWKLQPWQIGTAEHVSCVSATIRKMLETEKLKPDDVHLVLIKCPLLTSEKVAATLAAGEKPITADTYESMAWSRYASAIGIGAALGEVSTEDVASHLQSGNFYTAKASCSSGAELDDCHILILANDPSLDIGAEHGDPPPIIQAFSGVMSSAIDFAGLQQVLNQASKPEAPYRKATLLQVFAKAEADPTGLVAGTFRHTMLTDSDLHSTRHARAAVGGLIAGVTGDCHIYVSGGAEGQGPKGGGPVCVVARWEA
ncbi:Cyanuric acid amidohydrolase [Pseudocercospora fuligena]|uniref:Cyanuric acid amidohydrolase n=1 Tax=Pseudocercospora fuligena TaxID=685502 RepID=A0A8H6VIE0_9PEZI|nr:Cyanuric acid amidohydrolase [Pseudocercospora fuligena]